jgi:hypothetical protein
MKTWDQIRAELSAPFPQSELEWRFQLAKKGESRGMMLPFVSARAIMDRLDAVVGAGGWFDEVRRDPSGAWICRLHIRADNGASIFHEDVAPETDIEPAKGGASDALKRAAVKFGIGRYLYFLPRYWVNDKPSPKDWFPTLPDWAKPGGSGRPEEGRGSSAGISEADGEPAPQAKPEPAPRRAPKPNAQSPAPSASADPDDPDSVLPPSADWPFDLNKRVPFGKYKGMPWGHLARGSHYGRRRQWLRWYVENCEDQSQPSFKLASELLAWLEVRDPRADPAPADADPNDPGPVDPNDIWG